jgi:cytochrome P450
LAPTHQTHRGRPNKFKTPNVQDEIERSIEKLIDHIDRALAAGGDGQQEAGREFDVDDIAHKYSLDLIFRCFYKQEDLIDFDDPHEPWTHANERGFRLVRTNPLVIGAILFPVFRQFLDWLMYNFTIQGRGRQKVVDFVRAQAELGLEARKQLKRLMANAAKTGDTKINPNDFVLSNGVRFRRNMIDYIVDRFLDGKLEKKQYIRNSAFLLAAGEKTAQDCIVHTFYLLSVHQDVQEKLRCSIKADGIESEYLDWVLKESLRVLPPAPVGCSRVVERDMLLDDGHVVPAGTFVLTNAYVIHRLKQYWGDDADEFKPERWRDTSHHHPMQYIPFGTGPRGCPGKMFAMHEMKMLFAALLTRYKFEGQERPDAYEFHAPYWIYLLPVSTTTVTIKRI